MNYLEMKSTQSSTSAIYVDEYDQPQTIPVVNQIAHCQKRAEKSSIILVVIVVLFILTQSYRLALKAYEVLLPESYGIENFKRCFGMGR